MIKYFFLFLFILSSLVYIARFHITGFGIYGDGLGYYAYDRSVFFDHDLNFQNEFEFWHKQYSLVTGQVRWKQAIAVNKTTGLTINHWGVGSAILWLPFFLLGHLFALFLNLLKQSVSTNGYSWPYEFLVGEGNILLGVVGLYLLFKLGKKYVSQKISLLGIAFLVFGTNLLFYLLYEPATSHVPSLFLFTVFLSLFLRHSGDERSEDSRIDSGQARMTVKGFWTSQNDGIILLTLGAVAGLLVTTRNQDVVLVLPFLLALLTKYRSKTLLTLLGFFIAFIPQLWVWQILNGHFWQISYLLGGEVGFFHLFPLHFLDVLFSFHHGLFLWSPLLLLGLWGLKNFQDKTLIILLFSGLILEVLVTAYWSEWWQGVSLGGRFFVSSLPLFFLGLISLLNQYKYKVAPLIGITVVYSILLFTLFILRIVQ